jgi:LysR family transcriptional regulator, chromosome initiation inhibitor
MHYVAVASAAYAQTHCKNGLGPHTFRDIPFVAFNRKDDIPAEFVSRAFGLRRVSLSQRFVPSSEGQVRAVQAGWGAGVVPEMRVRDLLKRGELIDLAPGHTLPVDLYWHCWNLDSEVLDRLTAALSATAAKALTKNTDQS